MAEGGAVSLDPVLVMQGVALAGQAFRFVLEAIWHDRDRRDRRPRRARHPRDRDSCTGRAAYRGHNSHSGHNNHSGRSGCGGWYGQPSSCWPSAGNCPKQALGYRRSDCPEATPATAHACRRPRCTSRLGWHRR